MELYGAHTAAVPGTPMCVRKGGPCYERLVLVDHRVNLFCINLPKAAYFKSYFIQLLFLSPLCLAYLKQLPVTTHILK